MMAALLAALAVGLVAPPPAGRWAGATAALVVQPAATLAGGLAWWVVRFHRWLRRRRTHHEAATADVVALAELVGLGLSAGLTLRQSLATSAEFVHPRLARELHNLLDRALHRGMAAALASAGGYGQRLYLVCARAVVTGAPMGAAIDGFSRELAAEQHARAVAAAHRLPVRLMVPLALFILPGFVLLTVGPAVLAALDRIVLPD